uniref:Uncharacterized protein n=1 Tax=Zea mays TaxID=4577 RepID=A0A804MJJ9_MAIZE
MELDAAVEIAGEAAVLLWSRPFSVRIDSHITVDPVFLEMHDKVEGVLVEGLFWKDVEKLIDDYNSERKSK